MKWLNHNLVGGILIAVVSIGATYWLAFNDNRIQQIDYTVYSFENILQNVKESGESVNISINSNPISNLSELDIKFYNKSDKDVEDLIVFVDIYPNGSDSLKVISFNSLDYNNSKESVSNYEASKSRFKGGIRYGYKLNHLNRSKDQAGLTLKYLFESESIPSYQVQIDTTGFEGVERKLNDGKDNFFGILISGMSAFIFGSLLTVTLINRRDRDLITEIKGIVDAQREIREKNDELMVLTKQATADLEKYKAGYDEVVKDYNELKDDYEKLKSGKK